MTSDHVTVFLNEHPCHMPPGSTLGQVLAQHDPELALALALGTAKATDGRGIQVGEAAVLVAGAIFRVVRSARSVNA
ncbi:MAG: hypothetical protein ACRELE_04830 [Gemmatimonadales bacterium]